MDSSYTASLLWKAKLEKERFFSELLAKYFMNQGADLNQESTLFVWTPEWIIIKLKEMIYFSSTRTK